MFKGIVYVLSSDLSFIDWHFPIHNRAISIKKNCVFATNSNLLISISLQPDNVNI